MLLHLASGVAMVIVAVVVLLEDIWISELLSNRIQFFYNWVWYGGCG